MPIVIRDFLHYLYTIKSTVVKSVDAKNDINKEEISKTDSN